jgi:hypothetical protein
MSPCRKLVLLLLVGSLLVAAVAAEGPMAAGAGPGAKVRDAQAGNPLAGLDLFVDRQSPSYLSWQRFRRGGARRKAA